MNPNICIICWGDKEPVSSGKRTYCLACAKQQRRKTDNRRKKKSYKGEVKLKLRERSKDWYHKNRIQVLEKLKKQYLDKCMLRFKLQQTNG